MSLGVPMNVGDGSHPSGNPSTPSRAPRPVPRTPLVGYPDGKGGTVYKPMQQNGGGSYSPSGVNPNAGVVTKPIPNYTPPVDPMVAYLNAALNSQTIAANGANQQIDFDINLANIGRDYDYRGMAINHNADITRLGESQWRDVDLARWNANNDLALARQRFDTAGTFANRRFGDISSQAGGARDIDLRRLGDQLGFAGQDRDLSLLRADRAFITAGRQAGNDAAGRGAATSSGYGDTLSDIDWQKALDQRGAWNGYDRAAADNASGVDQTNFNYESTLRGATTSRDSNLADAGNSWAEAQTQQLQRNAYIDSIAKDYGTTRDQMTQAIELGIKRLGLDYGQVIKKLTAAQQSNSDQAKAANAALTQQILSASQQGI